jgi:hypothetical protein
MMAFLLDAGGSAATTNAIGLGKEPRHIGYWR